MTKRVSHYGSKLTRSHEVRGYNKLSSSNKKLFENFLINFYAAWEYPEHHQPLDVKFIEKDNYLKVTFQDMWLHVKDEKTWY